VVVVLVVAAGAAWESTALEAIGGRSGMVVLIRCRRSLVPVWPLVMM